MRFLGSTFKYLIFTATFILFLLFSSCNKFESVTVFKLTPCAKCIYEIKESSKKFNNTTIVILEAQIDEHFLDVHDLLGRGILFVNENEILLSDGGLIANF